MHSCLCAFFFNDQQSSKSESTELYREKTISFTPLLVTLRLNLICIQRVGGCVAVKSQIERWLRQSSKLRQLLNCPDTEIWPLAVILPWDAFVTLLVMVHDRQTQNLSWLSSKVNKRAVWPVDIKISWTGTLSIAIQTVKLCYLKRKERRSVRSEVFEHLCVHHPLFWTRHPFICSCDVQVSGLAGNSV